MLKYLLLTLSLFSAAVLPVEAARAEGTVALSGEVQVVRTIEEDGVSRETLAEPSKVVPGDHLLFTTHYSNDTGKEVSDFVITNPIPAQVALTKVGEFTVSVDGGKTFGRLVDLKASAADGTSRPATLDDVTHVRWILARLAAGETGSVTYSAVVR